MAYVRNEPVATDDLTVSQPKLATNTNAADDSFGVEHYKFSDTTPNNGFHNKVTTPVFVDSPPTGLPPVTVANPVAFGFQYSANSGVLQFSRGPNNAVPTPITSLHSTAAALGPLSSGTVTLMHDFTGLNLAYGVVYMVGTNVAPLNVYSAYMFFWNGSFLSTTLITGTVFSATAAGTLLNMVNNQIVNTAYWTIDFARLQ